jgi:hypothetical protein
MLPTEALADLQHAQPLEAGHTKPCRAGKMRTCPPHCVDTVNALGIEQSTECQRAPQCRSQGQHTVFWKQDCLPDTPQTNDAQKLSSSGMSHAVFIIDTYMLILNPCTTLATGCSMPAHTPSLFACCSAASCACAGPTCVSKRGSCNFWLGKGTAPINIRMRAHTHTHSHEDSPTSTNSALGTKRGSGRETGMPQ